MALRTIGVRLTAEISGYISKLKSAQESTKTFAQELGKAADSGKLDRLADRAGFMGAGLLAGFGVAVKAAADFDKQMSAVSAATHASVQDMKLLRAAALQAGKDTQYSATQAAEGITELSKAGVSTADILSGGLKGALTLAASGQLDVGEAAETAASAMTQFKLSGDKLPHVADLLAAAAGKAQGSVHDMGMALNMAGLVSAQTGLSIEEVTGGLAAFASAGLIGSDAGTSFKQMLLMLQAPSGKTKKLMDDLGISIYDNQGQFIGLAKFAGQLQERLKNLTPEARAAAMAQIFGADATRAASVMYQNGAKGIQDWIDKVNEAGYAQRTAAMLTDNLAGDIERLKGSLETLFIQGGSGANNGLRKLAQYLENLVTGFSNLPGPIKTTLTLLTGAAGILLLAGAGWVKLRRTLAETTAELEKVGPAGEKAAVGINRAASFAGRAAATFAVLQAAGAAINTAFGSDVKTNTDAFGASLLEWSKSGNKAGEAARIFGKDFNHLSYDLGTLGSGAMDKAGNALAGLAENISGVGGVFDESLQHARQRLEQVDASLTAMVQSGRGQDAAAIFNSLAAEGKKAGISLNDLKNGLPNYTAAAASATLGTDKLKKSQTGALKTLDEATGAVKKYTSATEAATDAINGQRQAFGDLSVMMKAEVDPVFGLLNAQQKLNKTQGDAKAAQAALTKAIKEHGSKSAEARAASIKLKSATQELALAAIDLQAKAGAVSSDFDGKMTPALYSTLKAGHLTEGQIKQVAKQFVEARKRADEYDGDYKANTSAPGAKQAKKDLDAAYTAANHFAGPYRATLYVDGKKKVDEALADLMIKQRALASGLSYSSAAAQVQKDLDRNRQGKYAAGGWTGPGNMFDVAGTVHADEFVIKKSSRQKIEQKAPGLLDHMNRTGEVIPGTGYATGGRVSMKYAVTAAKTRVPSLAEVLAVVAPPAPPAGGQTYKWIIKMVHAAFPGLSPISTYRPGARTLTGNRSYHAIGDAVDWPANKALAQYWNKKFGKITEELITPWNSLNIHNGRPHKYTGAVWNQHNFAGGNAHDHIAVTGRMGGSALAAAIGQGALAMWILRAIQLAHVPSSWASPLRTLIMRESGGNPRAINLWDSNARAGHPSKGLMQTIPSTFAHYRLKSLPNNIYDPVANIVAGIRYIQARYGSIFNVQQANPNRPPKGYAAGGLINEPIVGVGRSGRTYTFGEYGPETVIPGAGRWQTGAGAAAGGGTTHVQVNINAAVGTHPREIGRQVVDSIGAYLKGGGELRINGQKVF